MAGFLCGVPLNSRVPGDRLLLLFFHGVLTQMLPTVGKVFICYIYVSKQGVVMSGAHGWMGWLDVGQVLNAKVCP